MADRRTMLKEAQARRSRRVWLKDTAPERIGLCPSCPCASRPILTAPNDSSRGSGSEQEGLKNRQDKPTTGLTRAGNPLYSVISEKNFNIKYLLGFALFGLIAVIAIKVLNTSDGSSRIGVSYGGFSAAVERRGPDGDTKPEVSASISVWTCYLSGQSKGDVKIWWGHKNTDAQWACKNWIPECGNAPDDNQCTVNKIS